MSASKVNSSFSSATVASRYLGPVVVSSSRGCLRRRKGLVSEVSYGGEVGPREDWSIRQPAWKWCWVSRS